MLDRYPFAATKSEPPNIRTLAETMANEWRRSDSDDNRSSSSAPYGAPNL
jgi:hypothetical protein